MNDVTVAVECACLSGSAPPRMPMVSASHAYVTETEVGVCGWRVPWRGLDNSARTRSWSSFCHINLKARTLH